jgi:hypothetical protein
MLNFVYINIGIFACMITKELHKYLNITDIEVISSLMNLHTRFFIPNFVGFLNTVG